ncbi:MAG: PDZ domain-containing protein [Bdellovibrionales bacterium]|nr:PDZ domain-containing protein [Bdellovibrionales bacterium]
MQFNTSKFLDVLIEKYRPITNIVGTIIVSWILSGIAAQIIGMLIPKPKTASASIKVGMSRTRPTLAAFGPKSVSYYLGICERNIFDSMKRTACLEEIPIEEDIDPDAAPIKSDLNVALLGTMVFTNPEMSFATISPSGGGDSENYRVGDTLHDEARIYEIARNRVFFTRKGRREYIEVDKLPTIYSGSGSISTSPPPSSGISVRGDKVTVTRSKVDATLSDLNKIIQDARMFPNVGPDGKVNGFKVAAIRKNSIFEQLGLKNGDVIHKINGTSVDSIEKALPMLQLLKSESSISIDMTRGGASKSLSIDIQ